MSSSDSPQVKFVNEWHEGFKTMNVDVLAKALHKDFRCITYPRSLNQPDATKEEWHERTAMAMGFWTHLERTVHSTIEAPGKVISHYSGKAQTTFGVELNREAITIAHIVTDEDGSLKIMQIEEFVDSKGQLDSIQALEAGMANK